MRAYFTDCARQSRLGLAVGSPGDRRYLLTSGQISAGARFRFFVAWRVPKPIVDQEMETPLSQSDRTVAPESPPKYSFGKGVAIFLIGGPPTFAPLFWLIVSLANHNSDTLSTKINEALSVVFSLYGLLGSYAVGTIPSLIIGLVCLANYHHITTIRGWLLFAGLVGAAAYFFECSIALIFVYGGRVQADAWPLAGFAAAAGAISACLCALIVENSRGW
jgi:hypothetical protein